MESTQFVFDDVVCCTAAWVRRNLCGSDQRDLGKQFQCCNRVGYNNMAPGIENAGEVTLTSNHPSNFTNDVVDLFVYPVNESQ